MVESSRNDDNAPEVGSLVRQAAMRSNHPLMLVDGVNLRVLDVNKACHASFGYPLEILLSLRLWDLTSEQDKAQLRKVITTLEDGSAWSQRMLCNIVRGDNSTQPASLSIEVDANPDSSRIKFLVSVSEVAESEQMYLHMETALKASNIQFSDWSLSSESLSPWHVSDSAKPLRPSQGSKFLKKLSPVDRRETLALLDAASGGLLHSIDTTVATTEADGSNRWLRLTGVVAPQKPSTLLTLQCDVTESYRLQEYKEERDRALRTAEDKLQRSEAELQELLTLIPDFIVRLDTHLNIKYASPSFSTDCQFTAGDLVGARLIDVLGVEAQAIFHEALGNLHQNLHTHEFVVEETHAGKERSVWWTLLTVQDNSADRGVLCLGRDITERAKARRQLERQAIQLKRFNASLDDFASVVSHDLQAPLRHIVNFTELLQLELDDCSEQSLSYLEVLKTSAVRLQEMTSNLLNYSRLGLQHDRMETRPLVELIANAIDMLAEPMRVSQAKVEMKSLPSLRVDPLLMARLFQNLLSNSIKYCSEGITPEIEVNAENDGDFWTISWADKGIGIDATHSERIFKIFTRLHSDESVYSGSGVGLALCKRIAESHGGEIYLDCDYSDGAKFCIRLPVFNEADNPLFE